MTSSVTVMAPRHHSKSRMYKWVSAAQGVKLGQPSKFDKYRDELARMAGEGIAKKEMARRTGLALVTVKKYLKLLEQQ